MPEPEQLKNRVKARRLERGWSQAELAEAAGISRAAVSAIEMSRLVPSVAAALSLAECFGCAVEDLFGQHRIHAGHAAEWAWTSAQSPCRFWQASIGKRTLLYPVEPTVAGLLEHDGVLNEGFLQIDSRVRPEKTLLLASCDPGAALLAAEVARVSDCRLIVLTRSSQQALALLSAGLVHVAGIHLATREAPNANRVAIRDKIGSGVRILRVARWQEGIALAPEHRLRSIQMAVRSRLRWVGREPGSAARHCLDQLLGPRSSPRREAHDHRGVATAIRCGWADAGVCLRLVSEEMGLRFLPVRVELYELCYAAEHEGDPRIEALKKAVQSVSYRRLLGALPGYDVSECGELSKS